MSKTDGNAGYADACKSTIAKIAKPILPLMIVAVLSASLVSIGIAAEEDFGGCETCHKDIAENYAKSLHYTWAGVEGEFAKGAGEDFGLTVPKGCYKCHTPLKNCSGCHKDYGAFPTGHGQTMTMEDNCLNCHIKRPGANYVGKLAKMHKEGPHPDIHYEKGLSCMDCHPVSELHGDGKEYANERLAVQVRCEDCHKSPGKTVKDMPVTQYSSDLAAHKLHEGKLDCAACHSGWYQTCINCHLETKKTEGSTTEEFRLAVGHEGKVVPFYRMSVIYDNITKVHWTERTPHTITKAKDCAFCHDNPEVLCEGCEGKIMVEGGSFIPQETITRVLAVEMPVETPTPAETPAPTPAPTPGFELIFAVIAIAVVVVLAKRRR